MKKRAKTLGNSAILKNLEGKTCDGKKRWWKTQGGIWMRKFEVKNNHGNSKQKIIERNSRVEYQNEKLTGILCGNLSRNITTKNWVEFWRWYKTRNKGKSDKNTSKLGLKIKKNWQQIMPKPEKTYCREFWRGSKIHASFIFSQKRPKEKAFPVNNIKKSVIVPLDFK